MSGKTAEGLCEFRRSLIAQPVECRISERSEVLGSISPGDRATILREHFVPQIMHAVFDGTPMSACDFEEPSGIGFLARQ